MRTFPRLAVAGLLLASAGLAAAHTYPEKPIRFIVPFPAGGPTDIVSRYVADGLSKELGQPIIIENLAGAGGSIGMTSLSKAEPDGYTIGLGTSGTHSVNPHVYGDKLGYDALRGFTPISTVVSYVNILVMHPSVPAENVGQLVQYAKDNPNTVSFASSGNGATNHLSGELLKSLTGAPMLHVPYKGGAPALNDLLGGNTTFMFDLLSSSLPHVKSGKLRAVAVTSAERSQFAPDVPTMDESGVPGYAEAGSDLWFGIFGPANMPKDTVEKLNSSIRTVLESPHMKERYQGMFLEVKTTTAQEFVDIVANDHVKWGKVIQDANIQTQ